MELTDEQKEALMKEFVEKAQADFVEKAKAEFIKETKADVEKINKLIADERKTFEDMLKGRLSDGDFKAYQEKSRAAEDVLQKRVDDIETKMNRLPIETAGQKTEAPSEETKAFEKWLRKGDKGVTPEEFKVLKISDSETGGYLAVAEYVAEITKTITEFSPVRSLARIRKTSNYAVQIPKRTGQFSGYWVAEAGEKEEAEGLEYGLETITPHCMAALVRVTKENLEDSAFNLQAEIASEMGEQFAVLEGTGFIAGTAVGQPEGIITNAAVIAGATLSFAAGVVSAEDPFNLIYALKEGYCRNAKFLMKRTTVRDFRLLRAAAIASGDAEGAFLWTPSIAEGQPQLLAGYPIIECVDMPAVASGAYSLAFGDFKSGYTIVDRIQVEIQRLVEKYAEYNQIGFIGRKRVDGQVTNAEAMKIMVFTQAA